MGMGMAGEALVLAFSLSLEDRVDFALLNQRRAARARGGRAWRTLALWLVVVLLLLALASLLLPPGPPGSWTGPPGPVLPLLVCGLWLGLLALILATAWQRRRRAIELNRRLAGTALAEPMAATCTLDDVGFKLETPLEQVSWRWPMLREVAENERLLGLIVRPAGGFGLPKHTLTAAQVAAVKAFCAARLKP